MFPDINSIIAIVRSLFKATTSDEPRVKRLLVAGGITSIIAIVSAILIILVFPEKTHPTESKTLLGFFILSMLITIALALTIHGIITGEEQLAKDQKLEEQEKKASENPDQPKLAWDVARTKLENYLDRNISQLRSIFFLSVSIMVVGFGLIVYGSIIALDDPSKLNAAILVTVAGAITDFIGASFLILHRSIMKQATDNVSVLERINAVGMAVQVIESISDNDKKIKEKAKATLATQLIELYGKKAP